MPNIFDPKNIDRLNNPERRELIPPRETLEKLGLSYGDVFVDVGAGSGYFSLPAAEITGTAGHVIATDVSVEMLDALNKRVRESYLSVETLLTPSDAIPLPDNTADMTFMAFVLHEVDDIPSYLTELKRITKPTGTIAIIDWAKVASPMGPPLEHRIAFDEALTILSEAGLKVRSSGSINPFQYFITALPA